jgi:hypothetical protein
MVLLLLLVVVSGVCAWQLHCWSLHLAASKSPCCWRTAATLPFCLAAAAAATFCVDASDALLL